MRISALTPAHVLAALILSLFVSGPCVAQWSWQMNNDGNDLWLQSNFDGQAMFDYRLGAGGAIGEMRDNLNGNRALLAPSFNGESTDRVIQWTAWDDNITNDIGAPGYQFYDRYNLTQAGTQNNLFAPTMQVYTNPGANRVDVYSVPRDQWQPQQQAHIQSPLSALTRYEMQDNGVLKMRRVVRVGDVSVNGNPREFERFYLEAWTPFRQMGVFNSMTRSVDASGNPDPTKSYQAGASYPYYQWWNVSTTEGYSAVYSNVNHQDKAAVGMVFGTEQVDYFGFDGPNPNLDKFVLNTMDWNHGSNDQGIAMLPALYFNRDGLDNPVLEGSIIDQTFFIVPRHKLDSDLAGLMTQLADDIPAPALYSSDYQFSGELAGIVSRLNSNLALEGTRTDNLGGLAQGVPEPSSGILLAFATIALVTRRRRRRSAH